MPRHPLVYQETALLRRPCGGGSAGLPCSLQRCHYACPDERGVLFCMRIRVHCTFLLLCCTRHSAVSAVSTLYTLHRDFPQRPWSLVPCPVTAPVIACGSGLQHRLATFGPCKPHSKSGFWHYACATTMTTLALAILSHPRRQLVPSCKRISNPFSFLGTRALSYSLTRLTELGPTAMAIAARCRTIRRLVMPHGTHQ